MIGVLEHLKYPELVFKNFLRSNLKIYLYFGSNYFFISFLENSFQNVFLDSYLGDILIYLVINQ